MKKTAKILSIITALAMLLTMISVPAFAQIEKVDKDEKVYVLCDANGVMNTLIVSDTLNNTDNQATIKDYSILENIENVKGYEEFTQDGNNIEWETDGNDIYYRGKSDKQLPVTQTITYFLNGKETTAEDIAGKSGSITMKIEFDNKTLASEYVPFGVAGGFMLENSDVSKVSIDNGSIFNDGDRTFVIYYAMPGMADKLKIKDFDPDVITVDFESSDFNLIGTVSAVNSDFSKLLKVPDTIGGTSTDEIFSKLFDDENEEGLSAMLDGTKAATDGSKQIADGITTLSEGLTQLSSNSETLREASLQLFNTLLDTANTQLEASDAGLPALTVDNYEQVLSETIASLSEENINLQFEQQLQVKVEEHADEIKAAVTQGTKAQVMTAILQASQQPMSLEDYNNAVKANKIPEEMQAQINAVVEEQMNSDEVKTKMEQAYNTAVKEQVEIAKNDSAVVKKLEEAKAKAEYAAPMLTELQTKLNSFGQYYEGIITYTSGVDSAESGAAQLSQGANELSEGLQTMNVKINDLSKTAEEKYSEVFGLQPEELKAVYEAMQTNGEEYNSFSGLAEGKTGSVVFIFRTAGVE